VRNSENGERKNKKYLNKFVYFLLDLILYFILYYLLTLNVIFYKINKKIPILTFINSQYMLLLFKNFRKVNFFIYNLKKRTIFI